MKLLFLPAILLMACTACRQTNNKVQQHPVIERQAAADTIPNSPSTKNKKAIEKIGATIQGDFDGDGTTEYATVARIKQGQGNPAEDGTADEYAITFSNKNLRQIPIGCCNSILINEGDLQKDSGDDISIFQEPMNGCTYTMATFSIQTMAGSKVMNEQWQLIVPSFLIPTGCDKISDEELQKRIVAENGNIFYYETNMSTEEMKWIKKKVEWQEPSH